MSNAKLPPEELPLPVYYRELENEISDLNAAVDSFAEAMKCKLEAKARQGITGWRNQSYKGITVCRLISKANLVEYDPKQAVDIANFAMMLWYESEHSKG